MGKDRESTTFCGLIGPRSGLGQSSATATRQLLADTCAALADTILWPPVALVRGQRPVAEAGDIPLDHAQDLRQARQRGGRLLGARRAVADNTRQVVHGPGALAGASDQLQRRAEGLRDSAAVDLARESAPPCLQAAP